MNITSKAVVFLLSLSLLLGSIWLGWSAVWGPEGLQQKQKIDREIKALRHELHELKSENQELRDSIQRLKSDTEAQQDEVRRELGMLRKDEVILLPNTEADQ